MPLPPLVRQLVDKKLAKYCEAKIPPKYRDQIRIISLRRSRREEIEIYES